MQFNTNPMFRAIGEPRPVLPVAVGEMIEPAAFFYLTPEPDWLGRLFIGGLVIAFAVWISRLDRRAVTV